MAKEAERLLLDGTGWLPERLRTASVDASSADDGGALPEFLAGQDDESANVDAEVRGMVAD
jgi:hypothetical protein